MIGIHFSLALSAGIMLLAMAALFIWAKRRGVLKATEPPEI